MPGFLHPGIFCATGVAQKIGSLHKKAGRKNPDPGVCAMANSLDMVENLKPFRRHPGTRGGGGLRLAF